MGRPKGTLTQCCTQTLVQPPEGSRGSQSPRFMSRNPNTYCVSFEHLATVPLGSLSVRVSSSFLKVPIESIFPCQFTPQIFFPQLPFHPMEPSHQHNSSLLLLLQIIVSCDLVSHNQESGCILSLSRTENSERYQNITKK